MPDYIAPILPEGDIILKMLLISFTEDWLLVGTKPGHLLLYRIKKDAGKRSDSATMRQMCQDFCFKSHVILFYFSQVPIGLR